MDLLLDTHVLLWYISGNSLIPSKLIQTINDETNKCFISIASIWEIVIKLSLNKLEIKGGFNTIEDFLENNDFELLPIDFEHSKRLLNLELIHRDPFDRMIIVQAQAGNMTIISKDAYFKDYNIQVLW
ncbi:MAG: type II toxin-antitoxin system VapC family toxin [Cyclobacteriaceae bacterium]|nr:type II toxin-antitoxin system VapC family toxin [Cyclobacteriaceae bacterium]